MSDKRGQVEGFLGEVLGKMGFAARVEVKDVEERPAAEGQPAIPASISVALFPEGEFPGLTAGKRTPVVESLQFLANKVVNRGPEKQWVNVGVGGHPEPRVPGQKREKPPRPERAEKAERAERPERGERAERPERPERPEREAKAPSPAAEGKGEKKRDRRERREEGGAPRDSAPQRQRDREADESTLAAQLPEDGVMAELGRALAQKSAELGRIYAVTAIGAEDRARLLKAAEQVDFVRGKVEGEGRHRRVVFMPSNPKPMPKKSHIPDYDEEDEDAGEE